ncbi:hypothetical protein UH38_14390 [Aliterella atlantica CENA595]|uniref:DUF4282 domain-containing protein n=1 Tax=Aliterella atlantica CENA595 TaxID=1618023 RepID=A0A0D8ZR50_9CYAN|nr:hypothetical protein UH38_14390 [Aliterella atlantica CENA595]
MSNISPSSTPSQSRLYQGLINTLKTLKLVGFGFVALYSLFLLAQLSGVLGVSGFILALMSFAIGIISVYVTFQVLIAIIDLLSRIEENTR